MKRLYREVIKQIHPDFANDEADSLLRNRLTAEARQAFERGDEAALRRILEEYRSSPESVRGQGVQADLQRVLRQIGRIRKRLAEIDADIERLTTSEMALLVAKVDSAKAVGRDLLAELATDVRKRIEWARGEFEARSSKMQAK